MRTPYYQYIKDNQLNNILGYITEISYSKKMSILQGLQKDFDSKTIRLALNKYDVEYIKKNRVRINLIYNTLKGICQRLQENI